MARRFFYGPTWLWWLCALLVVGPKIEGQATPTAVPDQLACSACRISTSAVAVLGPRDGAGSITELSAVRSDSRGRYWVLPQNGLAMIYDASGRFLRAVGKEGNGPGEFQRGGDIVQMSADTILFLDRFNGRAVILTPDLVSARTVAWPWPLRTVITSGDDFLATGSVGTPASAGLPLHLVSIRQNPATIVKSFGPDDGALRGGAATRALTWNLAPANDGGFWSLDQLQYRVVRWGADGALVKSLFRRPPWFEKPSASGIGSRSVSPPPQMLGIQEINGLLWTFALIAAPTWRDAWPPAQPGVSDIATSKIDYPKLFHSVVEVIDPAAARVVARLELKEFISSALPGGRIAVYSVDNDGFPRLAIRQLTLTGR